MKIQKLEPYNREKLWKKEDVNFTPWLFDNLELLSERLDMELSAVEREKKAGSFKVDILAEDSDSNRVVIENQFGDTDHQHLGKALTYLSVLDAKTMIWICEKARPEHIKAILWLNESTPSDISFYLLKLETYTIDGSDPAPNLIVIAGPSPVIKEAGEDKKEFVERHIKRMKFWEQLLEKSVKKTSLYESKSPTKNNWIYRKSGIPGLGYSFVILMKSARVELYIDAKTHKKSKEIFDDLYVQKIEIEAEFGDQLDWQRLDMKKASRIAYWIKDKGLSTEDKWDEIQNKMITKMIKLEEVMGKRIKK